MNPNTECPPTVNVRLRRETGCPPPQEDEGGFYYVSIRAAHADLFSCPGSGRAGFRQDRPAFLTARWKRTGPGERRKACSGPYTFDQPCPLEAEHIYLEGKIYTVRIRTVSQELAEFFIRRLPGAGNDCIHVLSGQLRLIPRCPSGTGAFPDSRGGKDGTRLLAQSDAAGGI